MGLPGIDDNWWDDSAPSLTARITSAKEAIGNIIADVLSGQNPKYRYDKYTRWGAVENDIYKAIEQIANYDLCPRSATGEIMTPEQIQGHNLAINAKVIACQIHCEAMKAENLMREDKGYSLAYGEDAFNGLATEVERLAASFISE